MKVAVYHNLPSGGAKSTLYQQLRGLNQSFELDLYRLDLDFNEKYRDVRPLVKEVNSYSLSMRTIPVPSGRSVKTKKVLDLGRLVAAQRQIAEEINAKDYDAVFVTNCYYTQTPAIISFLEKPTLLFEHEPRRLSYEYDLKQIKAKERKASGALNLLYQLRKRRQESKITELDLAAARAADRILTNSYFTAEYIRRVYGRDARVNYAGIDTNEWRPDSPQTPRDGVLSVGALHEIKGHELALEAMALVPAKVRPPLRIVYGRAPDTGDYADHLKAKAGALGVTLELLSNIDQAELRKRYASSIATICAARLEPFGLTPLESNACGTPVIAIKEGGFRETVVEGQNGRFADPRPDFIAAAFEKLVNEGVAMGRDELHRHVKEQWTWKRSIDELKQALKETAEAGRVRE